MATTLSTPANAGSNGHREAPCQYITDRPRPEPGEAGKRPSPLVGRNNSEVAVFDITRNFGFIYKSEKGGLGGTPPGIIFFLAGPAGRTNLGNLDILPTQ